MEDKKKSIDGKNHLFGRQLNFRLTVRYAAFVCHIKTFMNISLRAVPFYCEKKFAFRLRKTSTSEMWSAVNAKHRNSHKIFSFIRGCNFIDAKSKPFVYPTFEHVLEYKMQFNSRRFLVENKTITLNGMVVVRVSSCVTFP